jgi:hypothetical protein
VENKNQIRLAELGLGKKITIEKKKSLRKFWPMAFNRRQQNLAQGKTHRSRIEKLRLSHLAEDGTRLENQ